MIEFLLMAAAFIYGLLISPKFLLLFPLAVIIYACRCYLASLLHSATATDKR